MENEKRIYKMTAFLNAAIATTFNHHFGNKHTNTFEIVSYIETTKKIIPFSELEKAIDDTLKPLNNQYLNELGQFREKNVSIEVLTEYLANHIQENLTNLSCSLKQIEVSESPVRTFCLTL